ncbi:MAG TPA: tetratricopeptide repeat protein, partial [Nitrospirota bacterium]
MKILRSFVTGLVVTLLAALPAIAADANLERDYEIALTKGQYAIELRDYATAIGHLKRALELKPNDQTARISLGIAYSRSGNDAAAQDVLQQVVAT